MPWTRSASGWCRRTPRRHEPAEQWPTQPFFGSRKTLTGDVDADGDADLIAFNTYDTWVLRAGS